MANNGQTGGKPRARRTDRPWAIRSVPAAAVDSALAAAKRRQLTVGEWLAVAIRREVDAERDSMAGPAAPLEGQLLSPGTAVATQVPHEPHEPQEQDSLAWLLQFHELIRRHGELREDGKPAPRLVSKYERRLNKLL